jgi:predicted TIM-barrel fold metal-dependent hydrolase
MNIIGLEEEFATQRSLRLGAEALQTHRFTMETSKELIQGDVVEALLDVGERRIATMDEAGIDMQVLSFIGPQVDDPSESFEMMREGNEKAAEAIRRYPSRFSAFASLPLADPKAAVAEFDRALNTPGFVGGFVCGSINGEFLDDMKYWPVLELAESRNAPIYIHPDFPLSQMGRAYFRGREELSGPEWGFMVDASCHFMRLLTAGVFDQFPKLTIILGHLGESIPYNLDRINNRLRAYARDKGLKRSPAEYMRENMVVTTSGNFSYPSFLCASGSLGIDNVLFSVDWPFESNKVAVDFLKHLPVNQPDIEKVAYKNATRVLNLKAF